MLKSKYLFLLIFLIGSFVVKAQEYHFGIRAGLNYSSFRGPVEADVSESFSFSNGFHFGVIGSVSINKYLSFGTEILYNQLGANYNYEGPSYYKFNVGDVDYLWDDIALNLDMSNSYINIPLLIQFQPIKKLEIMAGAYMGFLISPIAGGRLEYGNKFYQNLEYKYYSDTAGGVPYGASVINVKVPQADGTDEITQIYKTVGAYYQYDADQFNDDKGSYFNWFDVGLTGGIQYFINGSLYAGVRAEYGLLDITNDRLDRSLKELNEDGSFILKEDNDTNLNIQVSLGFKF